jgi:hypothetical protein
MIFRPTLCPIELPSPSLSGLHHLTRHPKRVGAAAVSFSLMRITTFSPSRIG